MRRVLGVIGITALAAATLVAGLVAGTGNASPTRTEVVKPTKITVTATDFKFKLSKLSVKAGTTVVFTVVNKGKVPHDFKIGNEEDGAHQRRQVGEAHRQVREEGSYRLPLHLAGPRPARDEGHVLGRRRADHDDEHNDDHDLDDVDHHDDRHRAGSTVTVNMFEYRYELVPATVPQGTVTFNIVNKGQQPHNFNLQGVKAGAIIGPNATETWTVGLPAKSYNFLCDVPFHESFGMVGTLVVT